MTREDVLHMCDQYIEVLKGHIEAHKPKTTQAVEDFIRQFDAVRSTHVPSSAWHSLGFLQGACSTYGIYSMELLSLQTSARRVV